MTNYYNLPKPFLVLAPMDDVTDTVFRQIVADCAPADLYMTEFVNVDGLQSPGRQKLLPKLQLGPNEGLARLKRLDGVQGDNQKRGNRTNGTVSESRKQLTQLSAKSADRVSISDEEQVDTALESRPIIAQLWGKEPKNYYEVAKQVKAMGFAGVDINMGCPDKAVIKNGCCVALVNNRELAGEIIQAVREAVGPHFPVSVKTRLGLQQVDYSWHEFLLNQKLNMLSIHGRTAKQMSKVPADWEAIARIRKLRDDLFPASAKASAGSPTTLIVGNGDVKNRQHAEELLAKHQLDGVMIGRGIFEDPFAFADKSPWQSMTKGQKLDLYKKHVELFAKTWQNGERSLHTLNKFCKIYVNGFDGAKELREKLMAARSTDELLVCLK